MRLAAFCSLALALHAAEDVEFFEKKIRPILATKCYSCHAADKQFGGLRLDGKERILRGGQSGPAAIAGKPEQSLLIKAVQHEGSVKMPVGGAKLSAAEITALQDWVRNGLAWPAETANSAKPGAGDPGFYEKVKREHWAYQPIRVAAARSVDDFMKPAGSAAAPRDLARRVSNALTGLPPNPADLQRFLKSGNYDEYVDRLLASSHFGERWARHWMDVVRYAETYGYEWNFEIKDAWRYRDYLIRAFNDDLPYDRFVREHIAGDLLEKPRVRDGFNESVIGTAFYRLGEMGHDDCIQFREIRTDVVDNQIDTLTKAFQGLTVSCARCHDHKIDPIPTEDYYSLYGILNSSRPVTQTLNMNGPPTSVANRLVDLKGKIRKELAGAWLSEAARIGDQVTVALAWRKDASSAESRIPAGTSAERIQTWVKLLDRKKVPLEDPLYPTIRQQTISWTDVLKEYEKETADRERFNREKFVAAGDFAKEIPSGWSADGLGLRATRPSASGEFAVATDGHQAVSGIFHAGLYTNLLSDRLNGVLRSPLLPKDKKFLSLQLVGGNAGAQRTIIDHCVIGEDHQIVENESMKWFTTPTKADQQLPVYVELNTKSDNPRLPERPGKFKDFTDDNIRSPRSFFGVARAYYHDEKVTPKPGLSHMHRLLVNQSTPFQTAVVDAITARRDGRASDDDIEWLDWLLREQILVNSRNLTPALRALTDEYRAVEIGLDSPAVVYGMGDFDRGADHPIFVSGSAANRGRVAPRHFLSLMPEALRSVGTASSGRRELAEAIANPNNPLTARVMANRIWHYVFGRGLVASTDNFGRYGDKPSNQQLLDALAARFVADGWSVKKMVRLLVTSTAFRQTQEVQRLDGESVRDAILTVSGRLDPALYGPSVQPHRGEATDYRRLFQGPLDGNGRRSVYLKITRMEGPRFLELFDLPPPLQTRGNRDVTNVPSQSLALLNDPFVLGQAAFWAERTIASRPDDTVDARLRVMFEAALSRPPEAEELVRWKALVQRLAQEHKVTDEQILSSKPVWKDIAHTFFNSKEFLYIK
jgi:hypothetical protein